MEILLVVAVVVAAFGFVGWLATHNSMQGLFWTSLGGIGLLSGYWVFQMIEAGGYDGFLYAFLLVLGSAPAGVALLLGAGIGLLTRQRDGGIGVGAIPSCAT